MKKIWTVLAAGTLLSIGGLASAAEPMQLTEAQMDSVAAGQYSYASSGAAALLGALATDAGSGTFSYANPCITVKITTASASAVAEGVLVRASASASSSF